MRFALFLPVPGDDVADTESCHRTLLFGPVNSHVSSAVPSSFSWSQWVGWTSHHIGRGASRVSFPTWSSWLPQAKHGRKFLIAKQRKPAFRMIYWAMEIYFCNTFLQNEKNLECRGFFLPLKKNEYYTIHLLLFSKNCSTQHGYYIDT